MKESLGKWAIIDIETTGIDPANDSIIDIGFLQFDDTKLIRKFSSLVRLPNTHELGLSQFIQKLTGITNEMLKKAPRWSEIEPELLTLEGHTLIAHNSSFEEKFLSQYFEKNNFKNSSEKTEFLDSIPFLSLLNPYKSSLSLESFIVELGIKEKEDHRGFEDSLDLLKVILLNLKFLSLDTEKILFLQSQIRALGINEYWFFNFLNLTNEQFKEIYEQIDFFPDLKSKKTSEVKKSTPNNPKYEFKFNSSVIHEILSDEKNIKNFNSHYAFRESQEMMSMRIGQSFKNSIHALIQAPTGTGKTLGYLLPSALYTLEEKKQILLATGTKILQSQLFTKDVAFLRDILGVSEDSLKISELVGSNNHLCELLFRGDGGEIDLLSKDLFEEKFTKLFFEMVFFHNQSKKQDERIKRTDLPFILKRTFKKIDEAEKSLAVDFKACTGNNCPFKEHCTYIQGLRIAKESDIIIGNHALMFNWPKSFPRPGYVVVDEAHKIEKEATSVFCKEIIAKELEIFYRQMINFQGIGALFYLFSKKEILGAQDATKNIREKSQTCISILGESLTALSIQIEAYFNQNGKSRSSFWVELPMIRRDQVKVPLAATILNLCDKIHGSIRDLLSLLSPYVNLFDSKDMIDKNEQLAFARFESFFNNLVEIENSFTCVLSENVENTNVLKFHIEEGFVLASYPINVGKKVHESLLQTSSSVIFTSATLGSQTGHGMKSVEWMTGYSYLPQTKRFKQGLVLPAVYDYKNKSKVFLCSDVPPMNSKDFVSSTLKGIIPIVKKLNGRTLFLYSSRMRFDEAREILLKKFEGHIPLFIQGMSTNPVEEFKKSEAGILLGMESFGEGIDIPGDSLQLVFIDKIPDQRQEKIYKDRQDFFDKNFGNAMVDYFLSERTRSLHQKLGRLLRTEVDHGAVIVVDSRVKSWKEQTLLQFVRQMEPYQIIFSDYLGACDGIKDFLQLTNRQE